MSAIAGILYFDGASVESGLIEKLTGFMKLRGPDQQTHWTRGPVALGHCMLRTTPESLEEHQPLMSQDKGLVLIWDGRLDNREELRRDLLACGISLRDNSDAELALQSYAAWGEACPKHLLGDFAFAVWDAGMQRLFCARDHMGARPFYYTCNDRFFAFASEDEALPLLPGVSSKPNEELIAYFLVPSFLDFDYSRSWLEEIRILPSAQWMSVSADGCVKFDTYWQLEPGEEASYASDEECHEAFLEVFGEAVRCRMRASGHVAAMMSGGLDSASIAAMVKRILPEIPGKEFHTYSAISDHPETCVESQCIQSLTQDMGDNAHYVSVPSFSGMVNAQDLVEMACAAPHPVSDSLPLPAMMCVAASRDGHRVMLHGASGDLTMFVPQRYVASLLRKGHWWGAWKACRDASRNNTYFQGVSPALLLLKNIWTAYVPRRIWLFVNWMRTRNKASPLAHSWINPEFAKELGIVDRIFARRRMAGGAALNIQQEHIRVLKPPHGVASGLMGYDRVAGRYGMEMRDPWSDMRVVDFLFRLPLQYKIRNGWTKYLARTAFATDLPAQVRWRLGKEHLGWQFTCRLMDETHGQVAHTLAQSLDIVEKYADTRFIRAQYNAYCESKEDSARGNVNDAVLLVRWLQRML